jgi:hypothetical protein
LECFWEIIPEFRALEHEGATQEWAGFFDGFCDFNGKGFVSLGSGGSASAISSVREQALELCRGVPIQAVIDKAGSVEFIQIAKF